MEKADIKHSPPINFRSLTVMRIAVYDFEAFQEMDLPALKHLNVKVAEENSFRTVDSLIPMLVSFGSQLENFYLTSLLNEETMPTVIWTVLPNVVELQTPYKWGDLPPADHPLRRVTLTFDDVIRHTQDKTSIEDFKEYFPLTEDGRFTKTGVIISHCWSQLLFHHIRHRPSTTVLWLAMRSAESVGVDLVDLNGLNLENYILCFLVHMWNRKFTLGRYRFRNYPWDSVHL